MSEEEVTPEETEDEPEAGEQEAEPAAEAEESETPPVPKQPTNEKKIVIILKDDNIMLGVQSPDCDPVYTTMKGDLGKALKRVPSLVAEAKKKWEANPRNPKANLPEPPPPPAPVRTSGATKSTKSTAQTPMF